MATKGFHLDFANFKKVGESKDSTTLLHPAGHQIRIAHSTIKPKVRGQLAALPLYKGGEAEDPTQEHLLPGDSIPNKIEKEVVGKAKHEDKKLAKGGCIGESCPGCSMCQGGSYADGGDAEPEPKPSPTPTSTASDYQDAVNKLKAGWGKHAVQGLADGGAPQSSQAQDNPDQIAQDAQDQSQEPVTVNVNGGQPQPAPIAQQIGHVIGESLKGNPLLNIAKGEGQAVQGAGNVMQDIAAGAGAAANNQPLPPGGLPQAGDQSDKGDNITGNAAPATSTPVPQPPASQSTPPQQQAQNPFEQAIEDQNEKQQKAITQKMDATKAIGQITGHIGDVQAHQLQQDIETQRDIQSHAQDNLDKINSQMNDVIDDIKGGHIDPQHYWNSKSAPQQVSTAIGLILGGIGGGLTHQENPALKFLNANIDRDINAQVQDLGRKENLVSAYYRQFGNVKDAAAMAQITQRSIIENQLKEAAAKSTNPLEQQRANLALADLSAQKAQLAGDLAMKHAMLQTTSGGQGNPGASADAAVSYLRLTNPTAAKEVEGRYVPGVGIASVPVDPKVREQIIARDSLQKQVGTLRTWLQQHPGDLNPKDINYAKTLANTVQDAYRRANGQGVFREAESKFVTNIVPPVGYSSTFLNQFRSDPKLKALEDSNLQELNSVKQGYGLPTQTANQRSIQNLTPQQKSMVDYAQKHPENPKSALWLKKLGIE